MDPQDEQVYHAQRRYNVCQQNPILCYYLPEHQVYNHGAHSRPGKLNRLILAASHINALYSKHGFDIKTMLMDGEFEPLQANLLELGININTTSKSEHVPKVEQQIRVLKECICMHAATLYHSKPSPS